jgi:copper chaperone CopZ
MVMSSRHYLFAVLALSVALVGCAEKKTVPASVSSSSVTPALFNVAGAPTVEFTAPDMMCAEGCGVKVKEILSEQPGAKEVVVDFDSKTATVAVEDGKFDAKAAVAALADHGFKNSAIKGAPAASDQTPPAAPADKVKDGSAG